MVERISTTAPLALTDSLEAFLQEHFQRSGGIPSDLLETLRDLQETAQRLSDATLGVVDQLWRGGATGAEGMEALYRDELSDVTLVLH